jgi:FkbM family methyltransferase
MYTNKTIIQIGSHEGETLNDPIFNLVDSSTRLFLVEPVQYLFSRLQKNYKNRFGDVSNIVFINKAVSDFIGEIQMTVPSENNDFSRLPFWASQLGSINSGHATGHIPGLIVDQIVVKTTTVSEIVKEYNIGEIELLHTDTEGHDYNILMSYDFSVKPKKIMFEHKHIDGLFRVGEKYRELSDRLVTLGYSKVYQDTEDTTFELDN